MAETRCPLCGGTGYYNNETCYRCQGYRVIDDGTSGSSSSSSSGSSGGGGSESENLLTVFIIPLIKWLSKFYMVFIIGAVGFAVAVVVVWAVAYFSITFPHPETLSAHFALRETAALDAKPLVLLPGGATVNRMGKFIKNEKRQDWAPMEYEGQKGWIMWEYLVPQDNATVTANSTVLRSSDNASSQSLATLPKGTVMISFGGAAWIQVEYNGIKGWVQQAYVVTKSWSGK